MSISATLFNAYTGLVAASRTAEVISDNVANAKTPGFGRRSVVLAASSIDGRGTGVRVLKIERTVNAIAQSDRRLAEADLAGSRAKSEMLTRLEKAFGLPGEKGSLSDRVVTLEKALTSAQSRPDSQVRLQNVLYAATDLAGRLNDLSKTVQSERMRADSGIAKQVNLLNKTLTQIEKIDQTIRVQIGSGQNANGLIDQRQVLIDRITGIIPIKTYPRPKGQIALITTGGAILLDGTRAKLGFSAVGVITPDMTVGSGALSGLTLNGRPIPTATGTGPIDGGSLSQLFEIRDKTAVDAGAQLDAVARNLVERFQASGLDSTLSATQAGLFTDGGARFQSANEVGLAQRLAVNHAADPSKGGALWRLRDGLGATSPGNSGNADLITGLLNTLQSLKPSLSGHFTGTSQSFSALVGAVVAETGADRLVADDTQSFARARVEGLKATEADSGVNTDRQMEKLLLVEKAYAANARVVSTANTMLKTLMDL